MFKIRVRAVVGVMIFLGYFLLYIIRYNLSVHVVDMAQIEKRGQGKYNFTISKKSNTCTRSGIVDLISWDDLKMGKLFSAYHIGFCVCFPIFHSFGDRLGPTWVVGITGITSGVLNCLTPASAYVNFWALFTVRMITGFCAGAMQPSMVQVLRRWVPPIERNHFMWAYCGITLGTCSTFLICAAIQYYSRWPIGFYISGGLQIVWSMAWVWLVTESPIRHPYISQEEQTYLINSIGTIFTIKLTNSEAPWKLILLSVPFWALCILNFGYAWMIISLCIHGPLYYSIVLGYSIYDASALTALPFFLRLVVGTFVIQVFHWYKHSSKLRIKHIRKYVVVVSHVVPGLLVASCWLLPWVVPGPILLTIAVALTAAGMDMTLDLCYEITPTFVSSVYTVIKIIGNTAGILVCLCVGQVTQTFTFSWFCFKSVVCYHLRRRIHRTVVFLDHNKIIRSIFRLLLSFLNSPIVWNHIWCFHATVLLLSGIIFLIWGETEVQPWNFRRIRPRRFNRLNPRTSVMSNITEVEEDSGTIRLPQTQMLQKL